MADEEIEQSMKETDEITQNLKEQEKQGSRDILRYYDRIHDKLFSFNNMLIAGYFVIIAVRPFLLRGLPAPEEGADEAVAGACRRGAHDDFLRITLPRGPVSRAVRRGFR